MKRPSDLRRGVLFGGLACLFLVLGAACGGSAKKSRFPELPEGCPVNLYRASPTVSSENIGPVSATCDETISDDDCIRTLKDQVCKLGGDIVWGVDAKPEIVYGTKKRWNGRAARTKGGPDAPDAG